MANKSLTILHTDELNGVTTFNYTLAKAFKEIEGNTVEIEIQQTMENGFVGEFLDVGIKKRTRTNEYDFVFINNSRGLRWCIENSITATKFFYFVHSIPTDKELQKEVFPPMASALPRILAGNIEVVVFSQKSKDYFDGHGHNCTLINNAIDLSRFTDGENIPPTEIKKILLFDLRTNLLYKGKIQNIADVLPNCYLRSISTSVWNIENEIKEADLVIAYGRSAIESLAMGKPTIIYGVNGGDGLVLDANKVSLAGTNFSGYSVRNMPVPEYLFEGSILQEIQRYNKADMTFVKDFIRRNYGIDKVLSILGLNTP